MFFSSLTVQGFLATLSLNIPDFTLHTSQRAQLASHRPAQCHDFVLRSGIRPQLVSLRQNHLGPGSAGWRFDSKLLCAAMLVVA
jgi:hypothetical protein